MSVNPTVSLPRLPEHITPLSKTEYVCQTCGASSKRWKCPEFPRKHLFTWARRELELWADGERIDPSLWFWSRSVVLWYLHVRKIEAFVAAHAGCGV